MIGGRPGLVATFEGGGRGTLDPRAGGTLPHVALARGVESIKSTTFREAKKAPASLSARASSLLIGVSKGSLP